MRINLGLDSETSLREFTGKPKRARTVNLTFCAKGHLQIVDETRPPADCLPHLLTGLRLLAPHLVQARVRRGGTLLPDELDMRHVAGRAPTDAEDWATHPGCIHLLSDHVVDAYVAQVLTAAHLNKIGSPDGFDVQALDHDRYLVVAKDPESWLSDRSPDPQVLAAARRQFAPAMLTADVVAANRRAR